MLKDFRAPCPKGIGFPFPEDVLSGFLIGTTFALAMHGKYPLDD